MLAHIFALAFVRCAQQKSTHLWDCSPNEATLPPCAREDTVQGRVAIWRRFFHHPPPSTPAPWSEKRTKGKRFNDKTDVESELQVLLFARWSRDLCFRWRKVSLLSCFIRGSRCPPRLRDVMSGWRKIKGIRRFLFCWFSHSLVCCCSFGDGLSCRWLLHGFHSNNIAIAIALFGWNHTRDSKFPMNRNYDSPKWPVGFNLWPAKTHNGYSKTLSAP